MSRDVAAGRDYDVWFGTLVVTGPVPDSETLCAVRNCFIHAEELDVILLVGYDNVDVVDAAEAVVHDG